MNAVSDVPEHWGFPNTPLTGIRDRTVRSTASWALVGQPQAPSMHQSEKCASGALHVYTLVVSGIVHRVSNRVREIGRETLETAGREEIKVLSDPPVVMVVL